MAVVFSGLCVLGVLGTLLMVMYGLRNPTEGQKKCCWEQNVTPEWTAKTRGFQVPETATGRRAGLHTNAQYDVALLTFTVTTAEADRFLHRRSRRARNWSAIPIPRSPGTGQAVRLCTDIYAHEFRPGTTRIHLWAGSDAPMVHLVTNRGGRTGTIRDRSR
ncbi:hypothetical protein ABT224_08420 [Streptomyces sp. NPDC001584]|uniref:hypothetical protein n=1 Tax=Streptomyces sp. NPDC001584 TaxID=3154521 RepID=UPI0033274E8D